MKSVWRLGSLLVAGTVAATVLGGIAPASASSSASEETCLVDAINAARASAGEPPLLVNADLRDVARGWSQTMLSSGHIYHDTNLSNVAPTNWESLGENVGVGPTCGNVATAFMNSPEHRHNILDSGFTSVGVGVVDVAAHGVSYATEDFMSTSAAPAQAPAPKTAPAPAPKPAPPVAAAAPASVVKATTAIAPKTTGAAALAKAQVPAAVLAQAVLTADAHGATAASAATAASGSVATATDLVARATFLILSVA